MKIYSGEYRNFQQDAVSLFYKSLNQVFHVTKNVPLKKLGTTYKFFYLTWSFFLQIQKKAPPLADQQMNHILTNPDPDSG